MKKNLLIGGSVVLATTLVIGLTLTKLDYSGDKPDNSSQSSAFEQSSDEVSSSLDDSSILGDSSILDDSSSESDVIIDGSSSEDMSMPDEDSSREEVSSPEENSSEEHAHMWGDWYENTPASCETKGEERKDCVSCDEYQTRQISEKGHKYANYISDKNAGCLTDGTKTATCDNGCGKTDTVTDEGSAKGHDWGDWYVSTPAQAEENGEERQDCQGCDEYQTRSLPATGHDWGDWYVSTPVTCTTNGEERCDCNDCDKYETRIIPATGHNWGDWYESMPASCETKGEERKDCASCDEYQTRLLPATGHDWGDWHVSTPATCTTDGEERCDCNDCDKYETRVIPATGHNWGDWIEKPATCTQDGERRRDCENCDEYETGTLTAKGHDFTNYITDGNAGCETNGTKTATCDNGCGTTNTVTDTDSSKGHDWGDWYVSTSASCETKGEDRRDCENCDKYETRKTEMLDHTYAVLQYDDIQHWYECSCGEVKSGSLENHYGGTATTTEKAKCTLCGQEYGELLEDATIIPEKYKRLADGTINFGAYPQKKVTDETLATVLTEKAGALPTASNSQNWISYKYYINGSNETDYMWYQDVMYADIKYRGVYFSSYRPRSPYWPNDQGLTLQDNNGYFIDTVYWFQWEVLNWTILEEKTGIAFLLCNSIIDCREYYDDKNNRTINGVTIYPNNYAESNIRKWLNETFYKTAFTDLQQNLIQTTQVDNSAESTNPYGQPTYWDSGVNNYACENTNDKIFLLSEEEVTKPNYGFDNNPAQSTVEIEPRRKNASDYSQSQGCYVHRSTGSSYHGSGQWWLRSPRFSSERFVGDIDVSGKAAGSDSNCSADVGVVPALKMTL